MTNEHTYSLPLKWVGRKYRCPNCGQYSFRPYRDNGGAGQDFGEIFRNHEDPNVRDLAMTVGKCDHERQCGHHFPPKQFFQQVKVGNYEAPKFEAKPLVTAEPLPLKLLTQCTPRPEQRSTIEKYWLNSCFQGSQLDSFAKVREMYYIGATRDGRVIYWLIGEDLKLRDGKVMAYKTDGHRDKEKNPRWIREMSLKMKYPNYKQKGSADQKQYDEEAGKLVIRPYFGTHLLMDSRLWDKPVALVEGEKSAIICATLYPNYIWLAIGTKHFDQSKLSKAMYQQREIYLFPDYDGIADWKARLKDFNYAKLHFMGDLINRLHETDNDDIGDIAMRWYLRFTKGNPDDTITLLDKLEATEELRKFFIRLELMVVPGTTVEPFVEAFDDEWLEREKNKQ